ncbi:MAG: hypothetical protein ABS69_21970 [Nitrosomonadales bacterium SCN 54-20]|nr:MAG: hypothetical protein ABS69_21970 [Nitrosomonadales bacterium SCN 54-20]
MCGALSNALKPLSAAQFASGSGMTDQEAMNQSRMDLKAPLLKNTRIQPQYWAVASRYLILRSTKE